MVAEQQAKTKIRIIVELDRKPGEQRQPGAMDRLLGRTWSICADLKQRGIEVTDVKRDGSKPRYVVRAKV